MDKNFWLKKWQEGDTRFHQAEINPRLIKYFPRLHLKPGANIFVPLCGKSKDMLWLTQQEFTIIGCELSPIACQDFFSEQHITPKITTENNFTVYSHQHIKLYCGDFFALTQQSLPPIQAIYDRAALIALPPDMRRRYSQHLLQLINPTTQLLLITNESSGQIQGPPFTVPQNEIETLYGSHFQINLLNREAAPDISPHLTAKGYTDLSHAVYHLIPQEIVT